jgi:AraC-like DNA-binding protein
MTQSSIIPLVKFKGGALPFKAQTIKEFISEQDETNDAPHSNNYYEMVWLTKGHGTLQVDMQKYPIESNTAFYLKPNETHQFQMHPEMDGYVFTFTDSFFSLGHYDFDLACHGSLYEIFSNHRVINIPCEMETIMKETALKIVQEYESQSVYKMDLVKRYFKIFLIYLMRTLEEILQATEHSRETELTTNFMELLDKNFKEKKMVAEYAAKLLVTSNYLNRTVKKITGFSAGHHIRQRVVLEAKRMGRYSDAGMKEIAYSLGFLDSAHFSRFFKAFGGINFSDFKRGGITIPLGAV